MYFYYAGYNLHLHGNEAFQRDSAGKMKWEITSFHQHYYLHLVTSGICQKKKKLI